MSAPLWTPGPWRLDGGRDPCRGQRVAATIDGSTFTICYAETPQPGGGPRHDMREANARLIAAAPDLYEALAIMVANERARYGDEETADAFFRSNNAIPLAALSKANPPNNDEQLGDR